MFILNLLLAFLTQLMGWELGGAPGASDGQGASAGEGGTSAPVQEPGKTFTQAELDRIVSERLRRERQQYSDYDDLKVKATRLAELEEAQKTEAQKAKEAQEKAEHAAAERMSAANKRLLAAEIKAIAAGRVHNPDLVVSLLMQHPSVKVLADGTVEGVKDAFELLLVSDPYLEKKDAGPGRSGGEFSGRATKTLDEQIAEAEAAGDWRKSNILKLQKLRSQT